MKATLPSAPTAQQIIDFLKLEALPVEGGLFRQNWRSSEIIPASALPVRYIGEKPFGTAIYALLTNEADSFSAMHKLPTDEVYHFYLGDPIEMLQLYPDGSSQRVILGQDLLNGQQIQYVARRDIWQGFHLVPGGSWALIGTTMAPGFTVTDFILAERQVLLERYPAEQELIRALTRPEHPGGRIREA
ncbi:MAG: cupin domain-containing protein [Caldilineaceae bacterium]